MNITPITPQNSLSKRVSKDAQAEIGGGGFPGITPTGNFNVQCPATQPGNAADTTDDVLFVATLPAGAFDQAGRQLTIQAIGTFANNAHSKRAKIFVNPTSAVVGSAISGGTLVADTGASTTAAVTWALEVQVTKQGLFGANTQFSYAEPIVGTTHGGVTAASLTMSEAAPIVIAVTGSSASSAAADVLGALLDVSWAN